MDVFINGLYNQLMVKYWSLELFVHSEEEVFPKFYNTEYFRSGSM